MTAGPASHNAASYRELFAQPVLRRLAVADVCARLPQGMVSITLLLVAAQHASMTVAGLVVAGYTLGQAATGPVRGRLADRRGLVPVAAVCAAAYAAALITLLATSLARAPAGLIIGTATVAGLVNPPLSPGMRSLWSKAAGPRLTQTAFALDAAVFDLAYITGPVLAGVLATGLAPAAAVAVLLALTGAAVITIVTPSRRLGNGKREPAPASRSRRSPLRSAALRGLLVTAALTNVALSATEVALIAYVRHHHALWASGPLLAEVSIGSIIGSLFLGNQRLPATPAAGRVRRRARGADRGRAVPAAAGRGRAAGRPVPRAHPGRAVRRGGPRGAAGYRHRDPGLGQLDHERRRGGRGRPGRVRLRAAPRRDGAGRRGRGRRCPQRAPRSVRPK